MFGVACIVGQCRRRVEKEIQMRKNAFGDALSDAGFDSRVMAMIDDGIKEADAGRLVPHAEVVTRVRSLGAA